MTPANPIAKSNPEQKRYSVNDAVGMMWLSKVSVVKRSAY